MKSTLAEIVDMVGGGTPSKAIDAYWGGDIPWASVKDFKTSELVSTGDYITELGLKNSASHLIPAGNIIIPTRMALGKVAVNLVDMAINQDLRALIVKDEKAVSKRYLVRFLESKAKYLEGEGKGATVKGITLDILRGLEVPLPPLPEQRRIAAILDQADALRAKRREALAELDKLAQSIFVEMFGDPVMNPKGWPICKIGDLLSSASYGTSEKSATEGRFPVLRMNNITRTGEMDFSDMKYMDLDEHDYARYLVKKGDVLFNRTNSADLVGKTAIFRSGELMAYAGYLIRLRVNSENNPDYLAGFLNTPYAKRTLRNMCKSIIGMANINASEIQAMKIAKPPLAIQTSYHSKIEAVNENKAVQRQALTELDALFASLQHRAFRGEL